MIDQRINSAVHCMLIISSLIVLANYIVLPIQTDLFLRELCGRGVEVGVGVSAPSL